MTNDAGFRPWRRRALAPVLFLLLPPAPVSAQDSVLPMAQAQQAVAGRLPSILDSVPANTAVPWEDPNTGLSGTIVPFAPDLRDGRFCRALRYTVEGASRRFAVEGERCRLADGGWGPGRVADHLYDAPEASPLIRDTQAALKRLLYYDGPVDGVASDVLSASILRFEHDEQVAPDAQPSAGLLELADAAINRIPQAGSCTPSQPVPDGWSAACGSAAP